MEGTDGAPMMPPMTPPMMPPLILRPLGKHHGNGRATSHGVGSWRGVMAWGHGVGS